MIKRKHKITETRADKVFDFFNVLLAVLVLIAIAYPVWVVVVSSFSDPYKLMAGKVWIKPEGFTFDGYKAIFRHEQVWTGLSNSVFYTVTGTLVQMVVTIAAAYPMSRKDFPLQKHIALFFAFTMWFSGGLVPTYLLIKELGLFNSRWVMILPSAMSVWNMIILRTYFESSISNELFESAILDGCDDFKYLIKIAVPLAKPSLAVIALYYMVGNWNVFMSAYLYLTKQELYPIQIVLREILLLGKVEEVSTNSTDAGNAQLMSELLKYSLVIVASLPMILVYPFIQKYFVKGMMIGAVKG